MAELHFEWLSLRFGMSIALNMQGLSWPLREIVDIANKDHTSLLRPNYRIETHAECRAWREYPRRPSAHNQDRDNDRG